MIKDKEIFLTFNQDLQK